LYPVLIELRSLGIAVLSYQAMHVVTIAVCLWLAPRWAERLEGLEAARVRRALLWFAVAPWIGGRAHFVIAHRSSFGERPLAALNLLGGIHAGGAVLALALALPLVVRLCGLPIARFADAFTPTFGVGIALGRLGCFLHGCCKGTASQWPWALSFPYTVDPTALVHPLQLYFAGVGALLALGAWRLCPRKRFDGQVALAGLLFFAVTTILLEFLRGDAAGGTRFGPLPQLQAAAMVLALLAALGLAFMRRRGASVPDAA
jgi:phosphatidylglycerol:prolipoprotein diacylglycerol transferase